jgi:hypothetical protein
MSTYRILYLGRGVLDDAEELASDDLVAVAKTASSKHPSLTAEIWLDNKKVAVVRPCSHHGPRH